MSPFSSSSQSKTVLSNSLEKHRIESLKKRVTSHIKFQYNTTYFRVIGQRLYSIEFDEGTFAREFIFNSSECQKRPESCKLDIIPSSRLAVNPKYFFGVRSFALVKQNGNYNSHKGGEYCEHFNAIPVNYWFLSPWHYDRYRSMKISYH